MEYAAYHTPSSGPCQMRKRGEAVPLPSRGIRQEQHGSSPAAGGGRQGWGDFQTGMEIRLTAEGFCGILDTARNGRISEWRRPCPRVCPMASARLAWFDWHGPKMGQYRIQAAVSGPFPPANIRGAACSKQLGMPPERGSTGPIFAFAA